MRYLLRANRLFLIPSLRAACPSFLFLIVALQLLRAEEPPTEATDRNDALERRWDVQSVGPFEVLTDAVPALAGRCRSTIKDCSDAFYRNFIDKPLRDRVRIYLCKDAESYQQCCHEVGETEPTTPYGFYLSHKKVMMMDISTGTGTLVHEMVHALVEPDFPEIPAWFNEGFASLFEQCRREGQEILGLVNWRLPIVQEALRDGTSVPLREVMSSDTNTFYGDGKGVRYAQARYLCLYLQECGLLQAYYKDFRDRFSDDKTGISQLEKTSQQKLEELEADWKKWVAKLKR